MDISRTELAAKVDKMLIGMEANPKNELWIKKTNTLKERYSLYGGLVKNRNDAGVKRASATENLAKTEDSLIEELKVINKLIESFASKKDAKFKEFIKSGTMTDVIYLSMGKLLQEAKYLAEGLKNNIGDNVSQEIVDKLNEKINAFALALKTSELVKIEEGAATTALKNEEDDFRSLVKKTEAFIKSQVPESEYPNYL